MARRHPHTRSELRERLWFSAACAAVVALLTFAAVLGARHGGEDGGPVVGARQVQGLVLLVGGVLFAIAAIRSAYAGLTLMTLGRRGYCCECGYHLKGNVSGRCPECGEPVTGRHPSASEWEQ